MRRLEWLFLSSLVACARPNYVTPERATSSRASEEATCAHRLGAECVSVKWETVKFGGRNYSAFLVKLGRPNLGDGTLVVTDVDDDLDIDLWMPEMGHGTGPVHVARVDVGTFRVTHVYLPHGGLWEVRITRLTKGGQPREQTGVRFTL